MEKDNDSRFVMGLVLGATIGAIIALLLAPRPGRETRRRVSRRLEALREGMAGEALSEGAACPLISRMQAIRDEQRLRIEEAIREGREAAARKKEELLSQLEGSQTLGTPETPAGLGKATTK